MNKTTIWYAAVLLVVYFTLVFCEETAEAGNAETQIMNTNSDMETDTDTETLFNTGRALLEFEGRTRRHGHRFWCKFCFLFANKYNLLLCNSWSRNS